MATEMRRFTVSVSTDMDFKLDEAKKEIYYKSTQNKMIRDLLSRGLQNLEAEKVANEKGQDRAS
ncbi:MAG: hypothetical protein RR869_08780 [Lachnospiraceae bacterium]